MAKSSSKNEPCCSKDCKKNNDTLNSKIKDLTDELFEANNYIYHYKLAVDQLKGRLTEYKEREVKYIEKIRTLEMYRAYNLKSIKALDKELEVVKLEKDGLDRKLAGLLKASKNLDHLIESQRSDQVKEGVGYNAVPPPAADLYLSPKKDLSWTGLPEFVDDTVTDYSRPSPTIESTSKDGQNRNSSAFENREPTDSILSKPAVKFVKAVDKQAERSTTNKAETLKKPTVKYAEMYRRPSKKPTVRGNQKNWNNLKTQQLGPDFVLKKKACFNCDDFSHLANDCRKRVQRETTRSQNHAYCKIVPTARVILPLLVKKCSHCRVDELPLLKSLHCCVLNLFLDEMITSMDVLDDATYSASADDIAVQSCFFNIQLTKLSPKNCIPPEVLLRVSRHPTWSASEKAVSSKTKSFGYQSPMSMHRFIMDNPNITMEEYIILEEEKAYRHGQTFNWQTATYGKMEYYENKDDSFTNLKTEYPAIVFDDTSDAALSWEPTVSPLNNNELDFKISFDESDDEDYMVTFDKNSFSSKIISVDNLKTNSENENDKVNMPSSPSPEPMIGHIDDFVFFKDFENEFPTIVYNDALTSKLDQLIEPNLSPQHIDEFDLKDETSLSECDEVEQNILYFNDLFTFNIIYLDNLQSDKYNDDDDKIDIIQSSRDNVNTQGSNRLLEASHDKINKIFNVKSLS
nr:hypothetical protein [Tanacetum cinerariifolium]